MTPRSRGEPAVTAARRVGPSGQVVAIDQSPQMLAIARERVAALSLQNIQLLELDAEQLHLLEGNFDAALCRWGKSPGDLETTSVKRLA